MQIGFSGYHPVRFGAQSALDTKVQEQEALWGGASFFDATKTRTRFQELTRTYGVSPDQVKEAYLGVLQANLTTAFPHTQDTLLTALENHFINEQKA